LTRRSLKSDVPAKRNCYDAPVRKYSIVAEVKGI